MARPEPLHCAPGVAQQAGETMQRQALAIVAVLLAGAAAALALSVFGTGLGSTPHAAAAAAAEGAAPAGAGPAAGGATAPDPLAETWRLLAAPVRIDCRDAPLPRFLADLQRQAPGLKIAVDADVPKDERDFASRTITLSVERVPVCEVLDLVLPPTVVWEARPTGVRIRSALSQYREQAVAVFPVRRLLARLMRAGADPSAAAEELPAVVMRQVNCQADPRVAPWMDEGGEAQVAIARGDLVIRQTRAGHHAAARLLDMLCRAMGAAYEGPPPPPAPASRPDCRQALDDVRRMLKQPLDLDLEFASTDNAFAYIRECCPGLSLVVDADLANFGIDLSARTLCVKAKALPAEAALRLCMGDDLAYEVRPGYVFVTARDNLWRRLSVTIYPTADLCRGWAGWTADYSGNQEVIALLQRMVNYEDDPDVAPWSDEGGPAAAEYLGDLLIINQTEAAHRQAAQLLAHLRTAAALALELPDRPRAPVPCVAVPPPPAHPGLAATYAALETRIDVDFSDTPVMKAIETIAERPPRLNIALRYATGPRGTVTIKRQGVTRKALLEELFGTPGAFCEAHPAYVVVTLFQRPRLSVQTQTLQLVIYPALDLLRADAAGGGAAEGLAQAVQARVNHADDEAVAEWADEGGPASAETVVGTLVVRQTPHAHRKINALLQALRLRARGGFQLP